MIERIQKNVGLWLAVSALAVNGPRFVLVFLEADGVLLPHTITGPLLAITGVATGIVLTGGGAYIAHTIARPDRSGAMRFVLTMSWVFLLIFTVVLLAPAMAAAAKSSTLSDVLTTSRLQWAWAIASVVSVEVLAAGAMVAHALGQAATKRAPGRIQTAVINRLLRALEGPGQPTQATRTKPKKQTQTTSKTNDRRQELLALVQNRQVWSKADIVTAMAEAFEITGRVNLTNVSAVLSKHFGVSTKTVVRDLNWVWDRVREEIESPIDRNIPEVAAPVLNGR